MGILYIGDSRTLKNRLNTLYKANLIGNKVDILPRKGKMTILFNEAVRSSETFFTQINADVFNYLDKINHHAFRLLFYYKSHINFKEDRRLDYCYVGRETLKVRLKMGSSTIQEANEQLTKNKLIKITKHMLERREEDYDDNNELIFDRYNNHYSVTEKMM